MKLLQKFTKARGLLLCRIISLRSIKKLRHQLSLYYVNGAKTLPPPLSSREEANCLAEASRGSASAREELIVHNLRLVVYIAKKFENTNIGIEDLVSIGTIGLIKAVNTFKTDKNIKLATYASRCIENEILMYLRKTGAQKCEVSLDEPLNIDWDGNELLLSDILAVEGDSVGCDLESEDEKRQLLQGVAGLGDRERLIIKLRFGLDREREHTQKEVADMLGISQSYISRLEKKIIGRLKIEMEKIV